MIDVKVRRCGRRKGRAGRKRKEGRLAPALYCCRIVQVGALGQVGPGVRYAFDVYQAAATAESVTASWS